MAYLPTIWKNNEPPALNDENLNKIELGISDVHDEAALNTAKRHTQGTDTALGSLGTKATPVDADKVIQRDSESGDALVTSTWTQIKAFLKAFFDALYFLKTEHINSSAGAADAGKPIKLDGDGNVDATMINDGDIDHGGVGGLGDDDHTIYLLVDGTRAIEILKILDTGGDHNLRIKPNEDLSVDRTLSIQTLDTDKELIIEDNNLLPYTGWPTTPGVTLSFVDGTRTFTVTDGGSAFYYVKGVRYILGGNKTVVIDDTEGEWYIYFVGTTLTASQVMWDIAANDVAYVSILYWDATNNKQIILGYELHDYLMAGSTHERFHSGGGAAFNTGLGVSDAGSEDVNIAAGEIHDEDIDIVITDGAGGGLFEQVLSPAEYPIYHLDGASNWRVLETTDKKTATDIGYIDGSNDLKYNKLNGTWALATAGNNNYIAMWIVATNDLTEPIAAIMGQRIDNTVAQAELNNVLTDLVLTGMPFTEIVFLARVIIRDTNSGVYYTLEDITDLRSTNAEGNASSPVTGDHGALAGLGDDDHAQYPLLAGRSGGQTLSGSETTAEDLTLKDNTVDNNSITVTQIIASKTHTDGDGSDHADVATNSAARHTAGTDTALGAVSTKNPPIDADKVLYRNSVSSDVLVTSTWTQVKAFLKTYFDGVYHALTTVGIANSNLVKIDDAAAADNDYCKLTASGVEGRSYSEVKTDLSLGNVSNVAVDDTAYNATTWNTNTDAPTKNAVRDKIETMDTAIGLNTAKDTNVSTNLSEGTSTNTTVDVNSSDGSNATLASASTTRAGLLTKAKWDEIVANTAASHSNATDHTQGTDTALGAVSTKNPPIDADKVLYRNSVSSDVLVTSTWTQVKAFLKTYFDGVYHALTTVGIANSNLVKIDDAAAADNDYCKLTASGVEGRSYSEVKTDLSLGNVSNVAVDDTAYNATTWNTNTDAPTKNAVRDKIETMDTAIGLNTAKDTNVSTNLSEGTSTNTTVDVNSSDGSNATLASASTTRAGLLTKAKWDEIVANTAASHSNATDHTQGTDTALGGLGTKNPPIDADKAVYRDSTDSDALVTSTWAQVKAFLKTYFDTLYNKYVHPNHSGEVTSAADGATTIAADAVTYAKMQNISATDKILGRETAGAGDTEEIACTAAGRALLDDANAAAQRATLGAAASGANSDITSLSGNVTNATKCAFSAYVDTTQLNVTGDGTLYNALGAFWSERFDIGGNFNSTSADGNEGKFTAPVGGTYRLSVVLYVIGTTGAHTLADFSLFTSNRTYFLHSLNYSALGSPGGDFMLGGGLEVDMDQGDVAYFSINVYNGTKVVDVAFSNTVFTGVLLH